MLGKDKQYPRHNHQKSKSLTHVTKWASRYSTILQHVTCRAHPLTIEQAKPKRVHFSADVQSDASTFEYDEGHSGRYSVPQCCDGRASISVHYVLAQSDPNAYIVRHLTLPPPAACRISYSSAPTVDSALTNNHSASTSNCRTDDYNNIVMFSPGINTLHEGNVNHPRNLPAFERIVFYSRVMQCVPFTHLHLGTHIDQPEFIINATHRRLLRYGIRAVTRSSKKIMRDDSALKIYALKELRHEQTQQRTGIFHLHGRGLDVLQGCLSGLDVVDTPLKAAYRRLLEHACFPTQKTQNTDDVNNRCSDTMLDAKKKLTAPHSFSSSSTTANHRHFTIMAYSRSSIELKAALYQFISSTCQTHRISRSAVERRLRERLTVVTIGCACTRFPDGPAYIHASTYEDGLVKSFGVSKNHRSTEAGKDAIFLHCHFPFNRESQDTHNFSVCVCPLLAIVLACNRTNSFRTVWEMAHGGKLAMPRDVENVVKAIVVLTGGLEWLWDKDSALMSMDRDKDLPTKKEAISIVARAVGKGYAVRMIELFGLR